MKASRKQAIECATDCRGYRFYVLQSGSRCGCSNEFHNKAEASIDNCPISDKARRGRDHNFGAIYRSA
jgi:hypothetical protein